MLPLNGILRPTSTVGTPHQKSQKPRSRVSWGQLQVQTEEGEIRTEVIPEFGTAERDKLQKAAQQTYFGEEIDLTGLESSRRRRRGATIGFEENTSASSSRHSSGDEDSPAQSTQPVYKMSLNTSNASKTTSVDFWVFDALVSPHPLLTTEGVDTSDIIRKKSGFSKETKRLTKKLTKQRSEQFLLKSVNQTFQKHQYLLKYSRVGKLFVNNLGDPGVLKLLNEFNHLESDANRSKLARLAELGVGLLFDRSQLALSSERDSNLTSSDKPFHSYNASEVGGYGSLGKSQLPAEPGLACRLADAQQRKENHLLKVNPTAVVEPDSATMSMTSLGSPGGKSHSSEFSGFPISRFGGATDNELMSPTTPGRRGPSTRESFTLNKKYSMANTTEKSQSRKRRCISFDISGLNETRESVIKRFKILRWRVVCERTEEVVIVFNECVTLKLRISIQDRDWAATNGREIWVVEQIEEIYSHPKSAAQIEYRIFSADNNLHSLMSAAIDYIQKSYDSLDLLNFLSLLFIIHHDLSRFYRQVRTRIDPLVRIDKKGRAKLKITEELDLVINLFTNELALEGVMSEHQTGGVSASVSSQQLLETFADNSPKSAVQNLKSKPKSTSANGSPTNALGLKLKQPQSLDRRKTRGFPDESFELVNRSATLSGKLPKLFQARFIDVCHSTFLFLKQVFNTPESRKQPFGNVERKSDSNSTTLKDDSGASSARDLGRPSDAAMSDRKFSEIPAATTSVEMLDPPEPGFLVQRRKRTATRDTPQDLGLPD